MAAQDIIAPHPLGAMLVGAGEIRDYAGVRRHCGRYPYTVCVDGGYRHMAGLDIRPQVIIGDLDSVGDALPSDLERITFPPEKNYTDTTLAVEHAIQKGCRRLLLAGMLGGRLDHTLANLQTLAWCAQRGLDCRATDGVIDVWAVSEGALELQPRPHHYFSVFSASQQSVVSIEGAQYPLSGHLLTSFVPRAVSNEFLGQPAIITAEQGVLLVMRIPKDTPPSAHIL